MAQQTKHSGLRGFSRRFTAPPYELRCEAEVTARDGSKCPCMRAKAVGIYCRQHAIKDEVNAHARTAR
jgi:hypothetical protein